MNMHKYYYDEYYNDVSDMAERYSKVKNPHIVGVYRNSLPIAVHLSSVMKCPLSIIKVEDDRARWLINYTNDMDLRPEDCPLFPRLIVVDINYGTGNTFKAIKKLPEFIQNPDYTFFSIYGNKNDDDVYFNYEQLFKEIVLPWNLVKEKNVE
jgi:hypothetical protein|tara:strand:+ start:109 stop:564 length:456 start_codon:yes stop_codon:yes gene_type:complete